MTIEKAASAGLWATVEAVSGQGVTFFVTLVLARMLTPADFGIMAVAVFFSSLATVALNSGFLLALVQRTATSIEEESAAFWWCLIVSAGLATVLMIAARPLAAYYEFPVLSLLLLLVAGQIVISATSVVHAALLVRRMEFQTLAKVAFASASLSGALAIVSANLGAGVWALGIQMGSAATLNTMFLWLVSDWRPILHLRPRTLNPLFNFTGWVSLSSILEVFYSQGSGLLIAKSYGPRNLGLFERARTLNLLPSAFITGIIGRVALPLFARNGDDRTALRQGMRRASSFAMMINLPVMAGFAVLPDLIIQTLYGNTWLPAAPILSVLSIAGVLLPVHAINLQLLLAQGGASSFFKIEVAKKVTGIGCLVIGIQYGVIGLAWGQVAASMIALFLNTYLTRRTIDYGLGAQIADLSSLLLCTLAMIAVIVLLRPAITFPPFWSLLVLTVAGALTYLLLGLSLRLRSFREAFEICHIILSKRQGQMREEF